MLKRIPFHPYLLAAYSVLALVALNMGKFIPWMALRSLVFFLLVIFLLFLAVRWVLRDAHKAALLLTVFLVAFFTYGHLYHLLKGAQLLGVNFGRHRTLLPGWLVILSLSVYWILHTRRNLQGVTQALNVILIIATCFPILQITNYEIRSAANPTKSDGKVSNSSVSRYSALSVPDGATLPDIYYIILDTYGRSDTLQTYFHFDNTSFVDQLKELGFYVASCSQSNYATTELSISSSLNMDYLDSIGNNSGQIYSEDELYRLLQNNAVRHLLKNAGYGIVAFDSGFSPTDWKTADVHLSMEGDPLRTFLLGGINAFEALELQTSAGMLLYEVKTVLPSTLRSFLDAAYTEHRERILFEFNKAATLPQLPGPKFVFIHILAPHSPFVFGANEEIVGRSTPFTLNNDLEIADPKQYIAGYNAQIQYINRRTLEMAQEIIRSSQTPPIIVIQGDHGPKAGIATPLGRMTILNAYYLLGGSQGLYPTITPVNSFRVIFNRFFGGQFDLLPDRSYFSVYQKPDEFTIFPSDGSNCVP
jgi:hypothetical protein